MQSYADEQLAMLRPISTPTGTSGWSALSTAATPGARSARAVRSAEINTDSPEHLIEEIRKLETGELGVFAAQSMSVASLTVMRYCRGRSSASRCTALPGPPSETGLPWLFLSAIYCRSLSRTGRGAETHRRDAGGGEKCDQRSRGTGQGRSRYHRDGAGPPAEITRRRRRRRQGRRAAAGGRRRWSRRRRRPPPSRTCRPGWMPRPRLRCCG